MKKYSLKPRILILSDMMDAGGMERQILELVNGLKQHGNFSVVLGVIDQGGSREKQAKELADLYLPLPRKSRFDISPVYTLIRKIKGLDVRLIHTYGWMSGAAGLVAARVFRLPVINGGFREAPSKVHIREKINCWCALRSNMIISNSQASLEAYGMSRQLNARVIYNGIDFHRFVGVAAEKPVGKTICMVANFNPNKDHLSLIEAFMFVRPGYPDTRLVLVGHDMGTLDAARKYVSSRGMDNCVRFVTDSIHPEPVIASSDICVLASSDSESFSNSILEYLYLRKPVVATDAGGNRELVQNGKTGILVPKQSSKALAEAICYFLTHPEQARDMGEEGHAFVRDHFTLDRMVNEYEDLYTCLLSA